jgi:hypothetical protein
MTDSPLKALREALAELVSEQEVSKVREPSRISVWDVVAALDAFEADHTLVDLSVCGEQCPAFHSHTNGEGTCMNTRVLLDQAPWAPVGKPCIWHPTEAQGEEGHHD